MKNKKKKRIAGMAVVKPMQLVYGPPPSRRINIPEAINGDKAPEADTAAENADKPAETEKEAEA